jgi:hypothetical protein
VERSRSSEIHLDCQVRPSGCGPPELEAQLLLARMVGRDAPVKGSSSFSRQLKAISVC